MEQTDVKNKKITRRQIIMVVAFLAVIIILAVVLWPKPVQQRQHVYFIVQDARVDFYWDSRTGGIQTITYQYDEGLHFPDITIYDEHTGERISDDTGYLRIQIKKIVINEDGAIEENVISGDPIDVGRYSVDMEYEYHEENRVIYHDGINFYIEII